MIYNRNKNGFKKTTVKIEHRQAQKNILNLIKESISKGYDTKVSNFDVNQSSQNQCKNYQNKEASPPKMDACNFYNTKKPIFESIYSSVDNQQIKIKKQLFIDHVIDFTIRNSQNQSKASKAQTEYITMLQTKIKNLEKQINNQKQNRNILEKQLTQSYLSSQDVELQKLIRFYHRARNVLVLQSVELVQCKNYLINELKNNPQRLKCLNSAMTKGEQLLQVYRRNIQLGSPRKSRLENPQVVDLEELKQLCQYQQKTIQFIRKQNPCAQQFNQVKLLRHQINRVCNQNQKLLAQLAQNSPIRRQQQSPKIKNEIQSILNEQLESARKRETNLQVQNAELKQKYQAQQQKTFKLKAQKECLVQVLDNARVKTDELEQIVRKNQQQIYQLKSAYIKRRQEQKVNLVEKDQVSTEELCRQLKPYPKYFSLLMSIINEYQFKINELQNWICSEREEKQKFMQWSTQVYHLLQSAQIPQDILQRHREQLFRVDHKLQNSKIEKLLRHICAFSIGVDDKDIKEMQYQLQQYILSLKNRNQVIKQVQFQDGSSVSFSQSCTEQEFD